MDFTIKIREITIPKQNISHWRVIPRSDVEKILRVHLFGEEDWLAFHLRPEEVQDFENEMNMYYLDVHSRGYRATYQAERDRL